MNKRIRIDELQPSMRIEKLDRSWLSTPFFRHKMTIDSSQQIAQLKACGVQTLVVNLDAEDVGETPALELDIVADFVLPVAEKAASVPPVVPFEEELSTARQVYQAAPTIV